MQPPSEASLNSLNPVLHELISRPVDPTTGLWPKICQLIDGLAIGTTVHCLGEHGVLAAIAENRTPSTVEQLADRFAARRGYLHLALRLLATQGWLHLTEDAHGVRQVALTDQGRAWLPSLPAYAGSLESVACATIMPDLFEGTAECPAFQQTLKASPDEPFSLAARVRRHVHGPALAAFLYQCYRRGSAKPRSPSGGALSDYELDWASLGAARNLGFWLLQQQQWATGGEDEPCLTPQGRIALQAAPQFFHPLSYLATFREVPELLFGAAPETPRPGQAETHLDRALDIAFSGLVFKNACAKPFLEIARPIFDRPPLHHQPQAIVDVGCGDGTLLEALYSAIATGTQRGAHLQSHPLVLVGVDPAPEARQESTRVLARLQGSHYVLDGDIGDPMALQMALRELGIDANRALYTNKSVLHDRDFRPPTPAAPYPQGTCSRGVFLDAHGDLLRNIDLERNLLELLISWRPLLQRHGMLVIEAHTVSPEISAPFAGRHLITSLEATHGYSHQYLLEAERFRELFEQAGYRSLASHDLNKRMVGKPLMTIDHYVQRGNPWQLDHQSRNC